MCYFKLCNMLHVKVVLQNPSTLSLVVFLLATTAVKVLIQV